METLEKRLERLRGLCCKRDAARHFEELHDTLQDELNELRDQLGALDEKQRQWRRLR